MAEEAVSMEAPPLHKPSSLREAALDDETRALVAPDAADLPASPPSAVEANFARYFIAGKKGLGFCHTYLIRVEALSFSWDFEVRLLLETVKFVRLLWKLRDLKDKELISLQYCLLTSE